MYSPTDSFDGVNEELYTAGMPAPPTCAGQEGNPDDRTAEGSPVAPGYIPRSRGAKYKEIIQIMQGMNDIPPPDCRQQGISYCREELQRRLETDRPETKLCP